MPGLTARMFFRSVIVVLFLFHGSSCRAGETTRKDDAMVDAALLRVAVVVRDIEISKRFYSYALGYRVGFDGDITRPSVIDMLQLAPGQTAHFVVLEGADAIGGRNVSAAMIGLLNIANPPLERLARPGNATLATGEGVMAIITNDIATVHERMRELDATILLPPTRSADGSESELVAYDPDGVRLHVVERHLPREGTD